MMHQCLNHPKMAELEQALGLARYEAVGLLETLWLMAAQFADDGDLTKYGSKRIAVFLQWRRDPDELVDALVECGWLDRDSDRLTIHDWQDHCPKFIHERRKKRRQRQRENVSPSCPPHVPELSPTVPGQSPPCPDASPGCHTPYQTHTKPNQYKTSSPNPQAVPEEAEAVISKVKNAGVNAARKAVTAALSRGQTCSSILALLDHASTVEAGPGLIYGWLSGEQDWPKPKRKKQEAYATPKKPITRGVN